MAHTEIAQATLATEGQMKEVIRLFEEAFPSRKQLEELALRYCSERGSAQQLIERAGELKRVRKFFVDLTKELSNPNLYADQVVASNYGYLSGYRKARPINEQITGLKKYEEIFLQFRGPIDWELNDAQRQFLAKRAPQGSEGYFAVVFDQTMVTHYEDDPTVDQSVPVTHVLEALSKQPDGHVENYRDGKLNSTYYHRSKKSAEKMRQLWESQSCPTGIILIPAQLGIEHAGRSVLQARVVIRGSEFPLDGYEVLQMVLTHENRLKHCDDLWIDLPGSEYSPDADGVFECTLRVRFNGHGLKFGCRDTFANGRFGSASGMLPR